jgi:hypothetical protein
VSSYSAVIDAVVADLQANVATFTGIAVHKLAPWNPEALESDGGKHLACWLAPTQSEVAEPFVTMGHNLAQTYVVMYWEPSPENESQQMNTDAAAALMDLSDAVKARFYQQATQTLGGSWRLWYQSLFAWGLGAGVRYIAWTFKAEIAIDFT